MRILAIDTASDFGSVAIHQDGVTLEEMPLQAPDGFSRVLFGYIESMLLRHGWPLASLQVIAAAAGPGSFTGVRVGLSAAKGLADAVGCGALAVSNLKALAECGSGTVRAVVIDARRTEVYAAVYDADLEVISPEVVTPLEAWLAQLIVAPDEFISPDFSHLQSKVSWKAPTREQRLLAGAIARLAERTQSVDPALLDANYVRRSDAELFWVDRPLTPLL